LQLYHDQNIIIFNDESFFKWALQWLKGKVEKGKIKKCKYLAARISQRQMGMLWRG